MDFWGSFHQGMIVAPLPFDCPEGMFYDFLSSSVELFASTDHSFVFHYCIISKYSVNVSALISCFISFRYTLFKMWTDSASVPINFVSIKRRIGHIGSGEVRAIP